MTEMDALRDAMRSKPAATGRDARADRTRAQALSPVRIAIRLALAPVTAVGVAMSIYVAASPYEEQDALRHLIAMTGCDAAEVLGVAPAQAGNLGYHARNDRNGNGISCEDPLDAYLVSAEQTAVQAVERAGALGAKFLRP